jgi:hypothetical protein
MAIRKQQEDSAILRKRRFQELNSVRVLESTLAAGDASEAIASEERFQKASQTSVVPTGFHKDFASEVLLQQLVQEPAADNRLAQVWYWSAATNGSPKARQPSVTSVESPWRSMVSFLVVLEVKGGLTVRARSQAIPRQAKVGSPHHARTTGIEQRWILGAVRQTELG